MSLEMDYTTLFAVMDSWETMRRIPDSGEVAGAILFKHFFQRCPAAKVLFGFPVEMDAESEAIQNSKRFRSHASLMIDMLDRALNMLGPDVELLGEILSDLGKKHARMGVKESYFPFMGEALIETLRETLGASTFTPEIEASWKAVYDGLSTAMIKAMHSEASVLNSWAKLKSMDDYDTLAGTKLFQYLFRKCPEAKTLFGFPIDLDTDSEMMKKSRRFQMHARYFIEMLDRALGMVEAKEMEANLKSLGELHVSFGVKASYFPIMGEALLEALEATLPAEDWNQDVKAAWGNVYDRLSTQMVSAMKQSAKK
ncbi:Leghemoglobin Lb120 [Seminavis robusta]|uniref:Leghemoglobin Lb120 n=1 Tax=Seminavis robusta TaxID=568900 RepID=A0A9N8EWA4_9STRA|nr:Leghemoglobin Lb120 [Seminavis robusta]|eukprot:Sro2194_g318500.1 Leghemoglobin Lb120 (312) ;mRNA; r:3827-4853